MSNTPDVDERQSLARIEPAALATDDNRVMAEIQAMVVVAKRFPRNPIHARDHILAVFTNPKLAQSALYQYARGGENITGPSIRAAEAIARAWGNFRFGVRELDQRYGESTVEAFAWDLETNVQESRVFHVSHKLATKKGMKTLEDPRDVYEHVANQGARRMRACILALVPSDITDDVLEQIDKTLRASIKITPELVASLVEKFEKIGVPKTALEANIQRRIDEKTLTPALVIRLGSIYNSIHDGMATPRDYFPDLAPAPTDKPTSRVEQAVQLLTKQEPAKIETPFEPPEQDDEERCVCGAIDDDPHAPDCPVREDEGIE